MNKRIFFVGLGVFLLGYLWVISPNQKITSDPVLESQAAPDFTVYDEAGKAAKFSDFKGKMVLVHFWATWCGPCREEIPILNKFYNEIHKDRFVVFAISEDENFADIKRFKKKVPFDFPVYLDKDGMAATQLGTNRLPESYLFSPDGRLVNKFVGPQDWLQILSTIRGTK